MGVLQRFERRLEEMVNGAFARAFKAEVQPVEIASALQRECDDRAAIVARGRTHGARTPSPSSSASTTTTGSASTPSALGAELAAMVSEHAEEQGYAFLGPVTRRASSGTTSSTPGRFRVRSTAVAAAVRRPSRPSTAGDAGRAGGAKAPWLEVGTTTYPLALATDPARPRHRGRPAHRRPRHLPPARRDPAGRAATCVIVDLGSTNGIVVDGERVEQARLRRRRARSSSAARPWSSTRAGGEPDVRAHPHAHPARLPRGAVAVRAHRPSR